MDTIKVCPICDGEQFNKFLTCKDYTQSQKEFSIEQCINCGFKLTNPRPSEAELGNYYVSEDYISHTNANKGFFNSLYQLARKFTLVKKVRLIFSLNKKAGSILDIGCGTGEFLDICEKNGWKTIGIEPGEGPRKFAIENYKLDIKQAQDLADLANASFDIITMWHVLEHVSDLNNYLKELKRLLTPGGFLIIAVPNSSSYDARFYGKYWAAYDLPRHLSHFTPKDITSLFSKHGMAPIRIMAMPLDAFYISLLSEKYKRGRINYIRAIVNGLISNVLAAKTGKEYSSQIYIIKNR